MFHNLGPNLESKNAALLKIAQNVPDSWYTVCGWSVDPQGHLVGTAPSLSNGEVNIKNFKKLFLIVTLLLKLMSRFQ